MTLDSDLTSLVKIFLVISSSYIKSLSELPQESSGHDLNFDKPGSGHIMPERGPI